MKPLDPASADQAIVEEELRILARVTAAFSEVSLSNPGTPDYDDALISLRDQVGEAKPEDLPALVEQMTRISAIAQRYGKGRDLPVDPGSPYFAHMRLHEREGFSDILIGKRGYVDRAREIQIVDWRNAPVSRIYYRYEEGDDYEERFGKHTREGVVHSRRNLTIEAGRLRRIGSSRGTLIVDDRGTWHRIEQGPPPELRGGQGTATRPTVFIQRGDRQSALGISGHPQLRADKHLPEIAALIDTTQFDLITQPDSGLVVLQGGAGTGKTTVALHRVAYLNFAQPKRFREDKILVAVPSRAMVRYIEGVLPSLGVRGVRVVTVKEWLGQARIKLLPRTPITYNDDTPSIVVRFKKHPLLLRVIRDFVVERGAEQSTELQHAVSDCPLGHLVIQQWTRTQGLPLGRRCQELQTWLRSQTTLPILTRQRAESALRQLNDGARDVLSDWADLFTDRDRLQRGVAAYSKPPAFSEKEIDRVCSWVAKQAESLDAWLEGTDTPNEDEGETQAYRAIDGLDEREKTAESSLDPPDDSLLAYLWLLRFGALQPKRGSRIGYEHVVVDEAQDLSAVELKILIASAGRSASVTLAGDTAQRLVFDNSFRDWQSLLDNLDVPVTSDTTLRLGYRSTREVMDLARHLIAEIAPQGDDPLATRSGAPVMLHCLGGQGEAIELLASALRSLAAREPLASVALIARYPGQAAIYAEALRDAEVPNIRLVRDQAFAFRPGVEVVHVSEVKGLEFDYVVLLDVNANTYPDTIESRHLLHIAATRAAHQLWLVSAGHPSPIIPAVFHRT
jgi:DNA helicase-2/ATP-dependent DNA helicase PcrA